MESQKLQDRNGKKRPLILWIVLILFVTAGVVWWMARNPSERPDALIARNEEDFQDAGEGDSHEEENHVHLHRPFKHPP